MPTIVERIEQRISDGDGQKWLEDIALMRLAQEHIRDMENVMSCLLASYEASFGNVGDALALRAIELVPDWRERADNFDPTQR